MGDRAEVYVHEGHYRGVFLYTHWEGWWLPEAVNVALSRKARWDESQYLARIIFTEMLIGPSGEIDTSDTGFGISASSTDSDDRLVDVDTAHRLIEIRNGIHEEQWSFDDFISHKTHDWPGE